ncbi:MAG: DUF5320 domain-containing protein [Desulfatirhabdiaceae bacterium]
MPGGDGTGPAGMGHMTGRRLGTCAETGGPVYVTPGFGNGFPGRRCGRGQWYGAMPGRGFHGRGNPAWRGGYRYAGPLVPVEETDPNQELNSLRAQAEQLEKTLNGIRRRMEMLTDKKPHEETSR